MKHTRGPWIASEYGDYGDYDGKCRVILGEGGDIRTAVVLGFDTEENQANARLISAAPNLIEALQRSVDALNELVEVVKKTGLADSHAFTNALDEIDIGTAAIARATGEQK